MSKISELSNGGALLSTDDLIVVRSGGNVRAQLSSLNGVVIGASTAAAGSFTTGSFSSNVSFADNAKAIFGAGSDLQIYHDGSNSWVSDQGTGQLILESGGAGVYIQKGATESMANFIADGAVSLYHDNSKKFETTASGILVTGSVTANPSGGVLTLGANGHITSKQSLDVATAGGRLIGASNRGILGEVKIEQTSTGANGGYIDLATCASGTTTPTVRMRVDQDGVAHFNGDVKVLSGDIQMGNGRGINFSPHSNAPGMTSETLKDYEEGTHECTVTMTSGSCSLYANYNKIRYTKIGNLVTIQGQIRVQYVSSPSGEMQVSMPFSIDTTEDEGANISNGLVRTYLGNAPTGGLFLNGTMVFNKGDKCVLAWSKSGSATVDHVPTANEYLIFNFSYMVA